MARALSTVAAPHPGLPNSRGEMTLKSVLVLLCAAGLIALAGCESMPPDEDPAAANLRIRQFHTMQNRDAAVKSLLEGLDRCGPEWKRGAITAVHIGVANCSPVLADGTVTCDMHLGFPQLSGGPPRRLESYGRLNFVPVRDGTEVSAAIQTWVARRDEIASAWEKLVRGQARDICPEKFPD